MTLHEKLYDTEHVTYYEGDNFIDMEFSDDIIVFVEKHEGEQPKDWDDPAIKEEIKCDVKSIVRKQDITGIRRAFSNLQKEYYVSLEINGCSFDLSIWFTSKRKADEALEQIEKWWLG